MIVFLRQGTINMKTINKTQIKILVAMIAAFVLANVSSRTIFLSSTPKINHVFIAKVINLPGTILHYTQSTLARLMQPSTSNQTTNNQFASLPKFQKGNNMQTVPDSLLKPITKGVYAGETITNNNEKVVYIRVTKDAEIEERVIDYNGQKITIRAPKGTFK